MVNEVALANCGGSTKALWCQTGAHGLMKLKDKGRVPRDTQGWMWRFPEEVVTHTLDLGLNPMEFHCHPNLMSWPASDGTAKGICVLARGTVRVKFRFRVMAKAWLLFGL
jgi:hypothetical protein